MTPLSCCCHPGRLRSRLCQVCFASLVSLVEIHLCTYLDYPRRMGESPKIMGINQSPKCSVFFRAKVLTGTPLRLQLDANRSRDTPENAHRHVPWSSSAAMDGYEEVEPDNQQGSNLRFRGSQFLLNHCWEVQCLGIAHMVGVVGMETIDFMYSWQTSREI